LQRIPRTAPPLLNGTTEQAAGKTSPMPSKKRTREDERRGPNTANGGDASRHPGTAAASPPPLRQPPRQPPWVTEHPTRLSPAGGENQRSRSSSSAMLADGSRARDPCGLVSPSGRDAYSDLLGLLRDGANLLAREGDGKFQVLEIPERRLLGSSKEHRYNASGNRKGSRRSSGKVGWAAVGLGQGKGGRKVLRNLQSPITCAVFP